MTIGAFMNTLRILHRNSGFKTLHCGAVGKILTLGVNGSGMLL
jgi:hypothetical protein